jgi:hypothetical protein
MLWTAPTLRHQGAIGWLRRPIAVIGRVKIPHCSSLLPHLDVLCFVSALHPNPIQNIGPELVTPYFLLTQRDMQRMPRVSAFMDFVDSEIEAFRALLSGKVEPQ